MCVLWIDQRKRADWLERALLELIARAEFSTNVHNNELRNAIDAARRAHAAQFRESQL